VNTEILIYGAAFLSLGSVILAQPIRASTFPLAPLLWLLGVSAVLHGIGGWFHVGHAIDVSGATTSAVGLGVDLASYTFLFEFGRRAMLLVAPRLRWRAGAWRYGMSLSIYVLLVGGILGGLLDDDPWRSLAIRGGYLLCVPGALIGGFAIIAYYFSDAPRLAQLRVKPCFLLLAAALLGFGVATLFALPRADLFSESFLNAEVFPATHMSLMLFHAACAAMGTVAIVKILRAFRLSEVEQLENALAKVQAGEVRFRGLVESSSDWIWEVDARGVYTYVSPHVQDLLGYRAEEVLGKTPFDFMPPDEAQRVGAAFAEISAAQRPFHGLENTNLHKDGRRIVLETNGVPIFNLSGKLAGYRGMDRDITARKCTDLTLRASEANLAEAQRIAHLGSWEWDVAQNQVYWSAEMYRMMGLPPESGASYDAFLDVLHPDDRERVRQAVNTALEHHHPYDIEYRIVHTDGATRVVHVLGVVICDERDGRPVHMVGTAQDVTERKTVETRLRQAATVYENTSEGVVITGPDQRIQAVNPAFTAITGYREDEVIGNTLRMLQSGRHDAEFYRAMWTALHAVGRWQGEIWNRRKDGATYPEWLNISAVRDDAHHVINYIAVFSDITTIKNAQAKVEYLASHDALTGLPNRVLFRDRLAQVLARAHRHGRNVALLFVDLDRFKLVNDTLGHETGDRLLQEVARRLLTCVRAEDTVARMGGDEFVIIQEDVKQPDDAATLAMRLLQQMNTPVSLQGREIVVTLSVGISLYPRDGEDIGTLVKKADAAMYRAKEAGRNAYQYYNDEFARAGLDRLELETDLRLAIERGELLLHYQPQVNIKTGVIVGVEALARWNHPRRGMVPPVTFIPLAEETGLISVIGAWVLDTACAAAKGWHDAGLPPVRVAVNFSGHQISHDPVAQQVADALRTSGCDPCCLEIEVTESVLMKNPERAIATLDALKKLGVTLAIDDFGTGYSSLSYLKRFPIDKIKIDKSFVDGLPDDPDDAELTRSIIAMAHGLKRSVIAEGVETEAQLAFLRDHDCEEMQGYLFSKPVPAAEIARLLRAPAQAQLV
jgi:diguanylate cyclase (GGDEF)-like protein/PAS domain S-box-containing protein